MPRPNSYNANYGGIKTQHAGDWSAGEYHSHQKAHPNKLAETSEKRAFKPRPRKDISKPKPTTKVLDLSTGKAIEPDPKITEEVKKDLAKRNLK